MKRQIEKRVPAVLRDRAEKQRKFKFLDRNTKDNIQYYTMLFIPMVFITIFSYFPMFGVIVAFQDYVAGRPFFGKGVKWVGLKWFEEFATSYYFPRILRNTLVLNGLQLLLGFSIPILFALVVNEIRLTKFKKFTQTVSYLPYFLSPVVVAGMVTTFLSDHGILTDIFRSLGFEADGLMADPEAFPWIYVISSIWKSFGWSSIMYLSGITGIDPGLYEAAAIDGAGRIKRIRHITIPCLMPLIVIQLIMNIGGMLNANSEMILLLYNSSTYKTADVIGTYVLRSSMGAGRFSYGSASGLLMSILSIILVTIANRISRKVSSMSLW